MFIHVPKYAVIVAGGKGKRMQTEMPKQFLLLAQRPILMHTIDAFLAYESDIQIVVVLPEDDIALWQDLCKMHVFTAPHTVVKGGRERFYSVFNGLAVVPNDVLVAIHDGVRPFPSKQTIELAFAKATECGNAIPVIDVYDSMRKVAENGDNLSVNRAEFKLVQTPQIFQSTGIKEAYQQGFSVSFTDDASVLESAGHNINLVQGNRENIKITTPLDLLMGEYLVAQQQ